jgi:hypothetical protein
MKRLTLDMVEREIAALDGFDLKALQNRWRELYKVEPPFKIRSGFLRRAIAYRLQELVFGGLSPKTRRQLKTIANEARSRRQGAAAGLAGVGADATPVPPRRRTLSPGTRLLREWNGSTEIVDVLVDGFGWRGKTYRTLSGVAVAITGTKWSGPKFFGLTGGTAAKRTTPRPTEPELRALAGQPSEATVLSTHQRTHDGEPRTALSPLPPATP